MYDKNSITLLDLPQKTKKMLYFMSNIPKDCFIGKYFYEEVKENLGFFLESYKGYKEIDNLTSKEFCSFLNLLTNIKTSANEKELVFYENFQNTLFGLFSYNLEKDFISIFIDNFLYQFILYFIDEFISFATEKEQKLLFSLKTKIIYNYG